MCEYSVSVHERPGSRGKPEGGEWYELFLFWIHTLASVLFSACHIGNSHPGNHAGDYMRTERAWMVSVKHYTEWKACEWKSKLTSLKRDACYTEKKSKSVQPFLPCAAHLISWRICEMWMRNADSIFSKWGRKKSYLLVCESRQNDPGEDILPHASFWKHLGAKMHLSLVRVQSSRLGYKRLLKCFAKLLLWGRTVWAGEASLMSLGGADSNV